MRKVKFQIQQELGAKPETSKGAKEGNYTVGLTEWLVRTILLVGCAIWNPRAGRDRKSIFTDADREHSFVRYWVIEPNGLAIAGPLGGNF